MKEALKRIKKDLAYHAKQIEENNRNIESCRERIKNLQECNVKEQQLVEEYNRIIEILEG